MREVVAAIRRLIERRRTEPADDLISGLIQAQGGVGLDKGDRLSVTEVISTILVLNFAGHETTTHLIGNGTAALLRHSEQLALLRRDPSLIPSAVHELLRWCGPVQVDQLRYATEDVEIGGTTVRKGEGVLPILVGANFDPRVFEDPERLDITRGVRGGETHVAFSYGPHYCLGAALARQEAEVAFEALLRRFPHLALAVEPTDLEFEPTPRHRQLKALPLILDSTAN
jgi:cytochrome P450